MKHEDIMAALRAAEEKHERPGVDEVAEEYARLFPEEQAQESDRLVRAGTRKSIKDALRNAANLDEMNDDAPQMSLPLPGSPAPRYLLIPDGKAFGFVRFDRARKPDLLKAIRVREGVVGKVQSRIDDFKLKLRRLCMSRSFDSNEATVGEVLSDPEEGGQSA